MCKGEWKSHSQCLDYLKTALDPRMLEEGYLPWSAGTWNLFATILVALLRESTQHPPRCRVRVQWQFLNLCLSPIAVIENNYSGYVFIGRLLAPPPNSLFQEWTSYRTGFLLKSFLPAWSVLPKNRLSSQNPRKSKPNYSYLHLSWKLRKAL